MNTASGLEQRLWSNARDLVMTEKMNGLDYVAEVRRHADEFEAWFKRISAPENVKRLNELMDGRGTE